MMTFWNPGSLKAAVVVKQPLVLLAALATAYQLLPSRWVLQTWWQRRSALKDSEPRAIPFPDPRSRSPGLGWLGELRMAWLRWKSCMLGLGNVGVIAFYYPDRAEDWDRLCQAEFLGNFYPLTEELCLEAPLRPGETHCFGNAEAAYQALKFWPRAEEFRHLSGSQAFEKKRSLEGEGQADWTYGGFGSNMAGMFQVLRAKFAPGTAMHARLQQTGDAYLLEHNSKCGRDRFWSDNKDGHGLNWLGLQLMLLREESRQTKPWTTWIHQRVDVETGDVKDEVWQSTVRVAAKCLNQTVGSWHSRLLLYD